MSPFAALLAVSVVFPSSDARLPHLDSCYMIGSVPRGVTNLVVQGRPVDVYRTGAWVAMLDLSEGTNAVEILENDRPTVHRFVVAPRSSSRPAPRRAPAKPYEKLACAADEPVPHPYDKTPSETVVWIDPGHGGSDTGALSPHGFTEKDANLRIAREVRRALEARGYQVRMTRAEDVALALLDRPKEAHRTKADAFVSIHHNAPGYGTDPRDARYHVVYAWNRIGAELARAVSSRMDATLDGDIPGKGVLRANYAVTRSPEIPSCLVEVDFITTPQGEEDAWCAPRRRAIGEAIAAGIEDWHQKRAGFSCAAD